MKGHDQDPASTREPHTNGQEQTNRDPSIPQINVSLANLVPALPTRRQTADIDPLDSSGLSDVFPWTEVHPGTELAVPSPPGLQDWRLDSVAAVNSASLAFESYASRPPIGPRYQSSLLRTIRSRLLKASNRSNDGSSTIEQPWDGDIPELTLQPVSTAAAVDNLPRPTTPGGLSPSRRKSQSAPSTITDVRPPTSPPGSFRRPATAIKPTCSINLVCYRASASAGMALERIHTAKRALFEHDQEWQQALADNPHLVCDDRKLFEEMRNAYMYKMCSFWRRHFSMKKLMSIRLLTYSDTQRPIVAPITFWEQQELLHNFKHPSQVIIDGVWIDWVFRLRRPDNRFAIEFVEGWARSRIAIAGTTPLVFSTVVGLTWSLKTGDWQTAFTVAAFILAAGTLILALLAVVSGLEASEKKIV